ncbi:MAG TPA: protein-(glutamine-N5) methyltransferase, release factor-specific, partial [Candidatus Omnitrophota bacterium]|nr:protein-(glutamine-N5) methyltransferase, release factor-specific [Candidatus Omnitrophota bacterium]
MPSSNPLRENLVLLKKVESDLAQSGIVSAAPEAETLVRFFSRASRVDYFTGRKKLSAAQKKALLRAVERRRRRVPLQHILGETEFCGHRIFVTKDALVPRPETEKLCETALQILSGEGGSDRKPVRILDLGTGSG